MTAAPERTDSVFLDKTCISQSNQYLKAQSIRSLSFILQPVTQHATHVRRGVLHTHVVCVRARCAAEAGRNRPVIVLCSSYGAIAILGCVFHCIAAVLLCLQPLPVLCSLPACLHLPLRSVLGHMLITALFVHKVLDNFVRPAAPSALLRGPARQVQS